MNEELLMMTINSIIEDYKKLKKFTSIELYRVAGEILTEDKLCAEGLFLRYLAIMVDGKEDIYSNNEDIFENNNSTSFQIFKEIIINKNLHYYIVTQSELLDYLDKEFYNYIYRYLKKLNLNKNKGYLSNEYQYPVGKALLNPLERDSFFNYLDESYKHLMTKIRLKENYIKNTKWKNFYLHKFLEEANGYTLPKTFAKCQEKDICIVEDKMNEYFYNFVMLNDLETDLVEFEYPYISFEIEGVIRENSNEKKVNKIINKKIIDCFKIFWNKIKYSFVLKERESFSRPTKEDFYSEEVNKSLSQLIWKNQLIIGEEYIDIRKSLCELQKQIDLLAEIFKDKEKLNIFLMVRCEQYVKPYLEWIIEKKGKLKESDYTRFSEVFLNVALILKSKREEIEKDEKAQKYVEFDVIEREIKNYMEEEDIF